MIDMSVRKKCHNCEGVGFQPSPKFEKRNKSKGVHISKKYKCAYCQGKGYR